MKKIQDLKVVICVGLDGEGIIIKYPEEFQHHLDGSFCDDNLFVDVPKESGVYECDVEYWFSQGFSEGFPAAGESDWEFKVVKSKPLVDLTKLEI